MRKHKCIHIRHTHTLLQQGLLYYNRRIPKALGGGLIRIKLPDSSIAETLSKESKQLGHGLQSGPGSDSS